MRTQQYNQVKAIVAKYADLASNTEAAKATEKKRLSLTENQGYPMGMPADIARLNYGDQLTIRIYCLKAGEQADSNVLNAEEYSEASGYYVKGLLDDKEELFLVDNFDIFVEYMFSHRKKLNSFYTVKKGWWDNVTSCPSEWSSIVPCLLEKKEGNFFIPCSDRGHEFASLGHCDVTVGEGYANAAIRALALGDNIKKAKMASSRLMFTADEEYDVAIVRATNKSQDVFDAVYPKIKEGGEMLLSIPMDDMLSDSTLEMRRVLAHDKTLSKLIQLPSGDILLHIVKTPQDKCVMIDASEMSKSDEDKVIDSEIFRQEIEKDERPDCEQHSLVKSILYKELSEDVLAPGYYLSRPVDGVPVGNLSDISSDIVRSDECAQEEKVVLVNNLSHVFANAAFNVAELPNVNKERIRRYHCIKGPAVVMAISKKNIAIGYTTDASAFLVPKNLYVLKPRRDVDVMFLACALLDSQVKSQLTKLVYGKGLGSKLIDKWAEFVCLEENAVEDKQAFVQRTTAKDYAEQKEYVKLKEQNFKRSMHLRKHALSQNISAFDSLFHTLEYCLSDNMGHLKTDMKLSPISDMTVGDAFASLRSDLDVICKRVAHLTDEQDWGTCEAIEPQTFIEDYEQRHREHGFHFKHAWDSFDPNILDEDIFDQETGKIVFHKGETLNAAWFPKRALLQVLDNIVANAREHGFTDRHRTDYAIQTSWQTDGLNMVFRVSNNGAPLQEQMDASKVLEYGYTTELNHRGHGGIGGGEIAEIMHKFGGDVKVVSTPEREYTVTYVLSMPLASVY